MSHPVFEGGTLYWTTPILPVEVPDHYPELRPHVVLKKSGEQPYELDLQFAPPTEVTPPVTDAVIIPNTSTGEPDPERVVVRTGAHGMGVTLNRDFFGQRTDFETLLHDFWGREGVRARYWASRENSGHIGFAIVKPRPMICRMRGDELSTDPFYGCHITAQGLVLASLRAVVSNHLQLPGRQSL